MPKKIISDRMKDFDSSAIRYAFTLASKTVDPIDLSVGFPEDDTPSLIKREAIKAINNNHTRYTASNGTKELREALSKKLKQQNKLSIPPEQISVVPGVTTGILLTYLAILDPGDEIIIPDPFFPPYRDIAVMLGAKPVYVDTAPTFRLTAAQVEKHITEKTKAILINSPNNPTGAIYEEMELRKIAKLAEKNNIVILSDEIYEHFTYTDKHFSIGTVYENTLTLNGFSKAYAMTGWRLGYIAGPTEIIGAINELLQYIVFSTSSISQMAGLAALKYDPKEMIKKYKKKRDYIAEELSSYFELEGAHGAFYFFLKVPSKYKDDMDFVNKAAERSLIILPGRAFSQGNSYFRVAFGAPMSDVIKGIQILKELA